MTKIVVLVKEVPDSYGERRLDLTTGLVDRNTGEQVLDEISARAAEFAVSHAESAQDVEVTLLAMGPASTSSTLRKALSMGADGACLVADEALKGADLTLSAEVMAAALRHIGFDLVVTGDESSDGATGMFPAMLAEHLGVPHLTSLETVEVNAGQISGDRAGLGGILSLNAALPAVISITERFPDPRYPSFKGIMSAKKKPLETLSLADLGVAPESDGPRSILVSVSESPPRGGGEKVTDDGEAGRRLADFLRQNRLV